MEQRFFGSVGELSWNKCSRHLARTTEKEKEMHELHELYNQLGATRKKTQQVAERILKTKVGQPVELASIECWSCEIGLNASIGGILAAVAVAAAPEEGMLAAVAAATGLGEVVVTGILTALCIAGTGGIEVAILELCKAMGACS
jgi:hypothetical protein